MKDPGRYLTREFLLEVLEHIAQQPAPSQTLSYTRAPLMGQVLAEHNPALGARFELNRWHSGNAVLPFAEGLGSLLMVAQADDISYLVGEAAGDAAKLIPYCAHRQTTEGFTDATALRYQKGTMVPVAKGQLESRLIGGQIVPYFRPAAPLRPGDRIVLNTPLRLAGDRLLGTLDNAAGSAACLALALALGAAYGQEVGQLPLTVVFTDEEEGPPLANSTFARGARRLLPRLPVPALVVVVDGHDVGDLEQEPPGAVYAEASRGALGGVTPPQHYWRLEQLAAELAERGVVLRRSTYPPSRSDCVAAMEVTPNVLLVGYPLQDSHYDRHAPSQARLSDLVHLAQALFELTVAFIERRWL